MAPLSSLQTDPPNRRMARDSFHRLDPDRELRPERVPLEPERVPPLEPERVPPLEPERVPPERRVWRELETLLAEVREVAAAPSLAPRAAPRAAATATSPAFNNPAKPYTAPRRNSSLARGETAAAVAAAIAPASRSM